jgi:hypothetical protein
MLERVKRYAKAVFIISMMSFVVFGLLWKLVRAFPYTDLGQSPNPWVVPDWLGLLILCLGVVSGGVAIACGWLITRRLGRLI